MILKTQLNDTISRTIGLGGAALTTALASLKAIQTIKNIGIEGTKSLYKIDLSNIFTNISHLLYNTAKYYFGSTYFNNTKTVPAAVIAGIPLGSVQEVSHAISDRTLKYRATGGIFLAHQEGGDQTLRIVGKAWGLNRYVFLTMLDILFLYGSPQIVDLFTQNLKGIENYITPEIKPWAQFDLYSVDEGREEKHLTFPIITKSRIYTSMYIETYEFTEGVEHGLDVLTYSIFFRKYRPAFPYRFAHTKNEEGVPTFWYAVDEGDENVKALRMIDMMLELGYSASMMGYRAFQYLAGNSPETNIAHMTGINVNNQVYGEEQLGEEYKTLLPGLDYDLGKLSTQQKAELMALD